MTGADRSSEADEPELVKDEAERARIEAANALRQFDAAMIELRTWLSRPVRRLKPSDISDLHRILMERLSEYAGLYRPAKIKIRGSYHVPPKAQDVARYVEELCEYLVDNWEKKPSIHLAAYTLWRINWIHPFSDGNGRTARIVSYLILCAHAGKELPGDLTIPEQIAGNKRPYYVALETADDRLKRGEVDVGALEELLNSYLANQLFDFYKVASGDQLGLESLQANELDMILAKAQTEGAIDRKAVFTQRAFKHAGPLRWVEQHPALVGLLGAVGAAVITWLLTRYF